MTETAQNEKKLAYGHHRFVPEEKHIAGYGARLIYQEVMDGYSGVVPDRQDAFGDPSILREVVFPQLNKWTEKAREWGKLHWDGQSSDEVVLHEAVVGIPNSEHMGYVCVKGSPQGSYGYFYVTALLEEMPL